MPSMKQLTHALALNHHRNFHRAADAANISQSAFSRSIRALEDELGVQLFDRQGTRVEPTLYGEAVLQRAEKMRGETQELLREIQLLKGLDAGTLSVATGVYAGQMSAAPAIGELVKRHPNLSCRLKMTDWKQVADLVISRQVDLGLAEVSTRDATVDLTIEPIGQHDVVFFVRDGHPLAGEKTISAADLDGYPVATVRLPPRAAAVFPGKTREDKITGELVPSVEIDDLMIALQIVARSDAFGLATPLQLQHWLQRGEIKALPFRAPWMKLDYGFISLRDRMLSPAAKLYMKLVREIEKDLGRRNTALLHEITSG